MNYAHIVYTSIGFLTNTNANTIKIITQIYNNLIKF